MIYLCALLFTLYNIMLFVYAKGLYAFSKKIILQVILLTPINFFIFYASIYITEFRNDYIIMMAFFLFYSIEFKLLFNISYLKIFFGIISFAVNIFAMRTMIIAIIALITQVPVAQSVMDVEVRLLATTITLFLRPFTLLKAMKTVNKDQIFLIFSNKNNLRFSLGILCITFIYQISASLLLNVQTSSLNTAVFLLGTGVFSLGIYIATMAHAHEFSKLQLHLEDFSRLKDEVKKEAEELETLKATSELDPFTGMFIRRVAEEKLASYVASQQNFYIVYFDIDGLKITNDVYGHEEGDFYIGKVSSILQQSFDNEFIARLGGDEFLVLGTHGDEYEIAKKVLISFEEVKKISSKYEKQYETSISYGVVEVDKRNTFTEKELLDIADKRMYDFKKAHKRAR